MFDVRGVFRNFFREGSPIFAVFSSVFVLPAELILSDLSTKINFKESGIMLSRKFFENLHTVMAILVLFEQFLRKVCHISGPLL